MTNNQILLKQFTYTQDTRDILIDNAKDRLQEVAFINSDCDSRTVLGLPSKITYISSIMLHGGNHLQ